MKTLVLGGILLGSYLLSPMCMAQAGILKITKTSDIKDAERVENALGKVTKKVMVCVKKKLAKPQHCHCLYHQEMNNLKTVYTKVVSSHPDWKDKVIVYKSPRSSYLTNLSFYALNIQFKQTCQ